MAWTYVPGEWGTPGIWTNNGDGGEVKNLTDADYQAMLAKQAADAQTLNSNWLSRAANFTNSSGQKMTNMDPNAYTFLAMGADSGIDNKYDAINSWINAGAFYDPSLGYFDRQYFLPTSVPESQLVGGVDLNPNENDWGLIPYLAPLALGLIGGGALGLFGAGAGAGEAAAAGIGEAGAGSSLADIYGALTGQSVAAAPSAATGSALYGAATGADLAAALGSTSWSDLFAQPGSMSVDPSLSSWSQIYGDLTGQSVAPDWLNTLPNTFNTSPLYSAATTPLSLWDQTKDFLKDNAGSIAKTAGSMCQEQPFQLSVPQFNQMPSPQQDANYQPPQYMDASQSWGQPSVFQLSQSTWSPSMANALRSYNA